MNAYSQMAGSSPAAGQTARTKKRIAASLLVGWFAFWLAGVIAPCCSGLISNAQAGGEPSALQYQYTTQEPVRGDRRELPCPAAVEAQPVVSSPAMAPFDSTSRSATHVASLTRLPGPGSVEPAQPHLAPLPPPAPFHLRTARLLI